MGPNSINTSGNMAAMTMASTVAMTPADGSQAAAPSSSVRILYGDSVKADRLQAGLSGLHAIQATTARYIDNINPELGKL